MSEIQRWEVGFSQMNEHDQGEFVTWNDHCAALKAARNELPDVGSWTPEAKFKVGDRVRWGKDLGTVTEPEREPDYITINWDDGNYGTVIFSDLELIAPPVTTCGCPGGYSKVAEVPTSARPERKFKIGNQVTHRDSKKVRKIKNYYFSSEDNEWKYDIGFYYVESELTLYTPPTPAELIPTLKEHEWVRVTTTYNEKAFEGTVFFAHGAIMVGLNILAPNDSPPNPSITSIERCDAPEVK